MIDFEYWSKYYLSRFRLIKEEEEEEEEDDDDDDDDDDNFTCSIRSESLILNFFDIHKLVTSPFCRHCQKQIGSPFTKQTGSQKNNTQRVFLT